ncbi:MAG: DUF3105 domain-containing protein [Polyangiales bacterium]
MLTRPLLLAAFALGCSSNPRPGVLDSSVASDSADVPSTDLAAADLAASTDAITPDVPSEDVAIDAPVSLDVPVTTDVSDDAAALDVVTATDVADVPVAPDVIDAAVADAGMTDAALEDAQDAPSGEWVAIPGGERCNARERQVPTQASPHVDEDAGAIAWLTNPPSSGPHFNTWTRFGTFPNLARGNWVHNLEHGGVVFLYRCAGDAGACDAARDELVAASQTIPGDPACMPDAGDPRLRLVITNDALIETPFAGAAWGWLYAADCVEPSSVRSFFTRHVGQAPEDFCADGFIP